MRAAKSGMKLKLKARVQRTAVVSERASATNGVQYAQLGWQALLFMLLMKSLHGWPVTASWFFD